MIIVYFGQWGIPRLTMFGLGLAEESLTWAYCQFRGSD